MNDLGRLQHAREFLEAVGPMLPAYSKGLVTYVAMRQGDEIAILYARLELSVDARPSDITPIATANLFAGQHGIDWLEPRDIESWMVQSVSRHHLPSVNGLSLTLLPRSEGHPPEYDAHYDRQSLQQRATKEDPFVDRVFLGGVSRYQLHNFRMNELERELHTFGVDTIEQLLRIYGLAARDQTTFEFAATPIAAFGDGCTLSEQRVVLRIRLAAALDSRLLRIFIKNADPSNMDLPRAVDGSSLRWAGNDAWRSSEITLDLPESLILDCRLTYAGRPQAEIRLCDIQNLPNPRQMLVDLVDPGAERLGQLLLAPKKQEKDFEAGVAWLLQLLGFESLHIGAMSNLTDEPDILAVGPDGEMLLIECTIKVPDDAKVTKLVSRTERMRNIRLQRRTVDPSSSTTIIPMLVCSLPPKELVAMRRKAESHSIIVLCKPDLESALEARKFAPNPRRQLKSWLEKPLMQLLTGERRLGID